MIVHSAALFSMRRAARQALAGVRFRTSGRHEACLRAVHSVISSRMRPRLLTLLLLFALVAPARATPEGKARAREAYRLATQHYNLGEYPEALKQFKEAYRLFEDASFLFNIGQCHRQMGNKQEAIRFYRTY